MFYTFASTSLTKESIWISVRPEQISETKLCTCFIKFSFVANKAAYKLFFNPLLKPPWVYWCKAYCISLHHILDVLLHHSFRKNLLWWMIASSFVHEYSINIFDKRKLWSLCISSKVHRCLAFSSKSPQTQIVTMVPGAIKSQMTVRAAMN